MAMRQEKREKRRDWNEILWEGPRKWMVIVPAFLLLLVGGWLAYDQFRIIPPPDVKVATAEEVVDFVSNPQGLPRMDVQQREQFLVSTWQYYAQASPQQQQILVQRLNQLPPSRQRVFTDATFDIMREHVMRHSSEYARQRSAADKARYVDKAIGDFERMRREVTGAGTLAPGMNVTSPFQAAAPKTSGEIQNIVTSKTSPSEQAKAEPFVNKVVERYKQMKAQVKR